MEHQGEIVTGPGNIEDRFRSTFKRSKDNPLESGTLRRRRNYSYSDLRRNQADNRVELGRFKDDTGTETFFLDRAR